MTLNETSPWLKHCEVIKRLRVTTEILRKRMLQTPDAWEIPWIRYGGSDENPRYRWLQSKVDSWWTEINRLVHGAKP